jgi:hypothetical protein
MAEQIDQTRFIHRIAGDGRISFVGDAWLAFAAENGYRTTRPEQLGRPLLSAIGGEENRHIYALLIERVRSSGREVQFGYRCDSPDTRRWMRMHMRYLPDTDEVEFESVLLRRESRPFVDLIEARQEPSFSSEVLSMCSWCKAVLAEQSWVEVEQAVSKLGLFAIDRMPRISHGICPVCRKRLLSVETAP